MTATPVRPAASLTAVACGLALAAFPVFLVGGLAVQIRQDLGFSETQLGAAVTGTFLVGALAGPLGGRLSDRIGARAAVLTGAVLSSIALAGIAGLAQGWLVLAAFLALAGVSFSFMDPGLAILIADSIPRERHGLAFGVKEASIPAATLAAGIAVPTIALTFGWRWAFLLGLVPLAVLLALLPTLRRRAPTQPSAPVEQAPPLQRSTLLTIAVGAALASMAASGIGVFLTESAVAMGMEPAAAGLLLATGSVAGIVARVGTGIRADRRPGPQLGFIAAMMAIGSAAMVLGSIGTTPMLILGTLGAFSGGWAWSGLLFLSLVRSAPAAPGRVAGIGLAGLAIGNALGPLSFGATAQTWSFRTAWLGAAIVAAFAALLMRHAQTRT